MDWASIVVSTALSTVVTVIVLVLLYTYWIIPRIVVSVRDELMDKIAKWVDDLKASFGDSIASSLKEQVSSLKASIKSRKGVDSRMFNLAQSYLESNLSEDGTDDPETMDGIISEAILKYGPEVVKAVLKSREKKIDAQSISGW